jgi:hypothetical protein
MSDVLRWCSSAPCSSHDVPASGADINLDFPGQEAQVGRKTLLVGCPVAPDSHPTEKQVPSPGTDWRANRCLAAAALSYSKSARLGRCAALQRFTCILARYLFGCICKLERTVEPPASKCGPASETGKLGRFNYPSFEFSKVLVLCGCGKPLASCLKIM